MRLFILIMPYIPSGYLYSSTYAIYPIWLSLLKYLRHISHLVIFTQVLTPYIPSGYLYSSTYAIYPIWLSLLKYLRHISHLIIFTQVLMPYILSGYLYSSTYAIYPIWLSLSIVILISIEYSLSALIGISTTDLFLCRAKIWVSYSTDISTWVILIGM